MVKIKIPNINQMHYKIEFTDEQQEYINKISNDLNLKDEKLTIRLSWDGGNSWRTL